MTEKEKMLAGIPFNGMDKELILDRSLTRNNIFNFNNSIINDGKAKQKLLKSLLGSFGKGSYIENPFLCDYGYNIHLEKQVFINYDCIMLDGAPINIGEKTLIGPRVQLITTTHPKEVALRLQGVSYAKPIKIGKGVWIGAGVIILPGVTIGNYSIIGAGSMVTKDIPDNVTAFGNPCKVVSENEL